MVKDFVVSILITLLLFQSIDAFFTVAYYKINKKYITDFFCVNKLKPEMQCHGKCFLKAKLVEQEDDNQKLIINFENETIEFYSLLNLLPVESEKDNGIFLGFECPFHILNLFNFEIFRPPPFHI